jgi:heme/copper-type cytochrome/quinol oxidase subunit 2
MNDRPHKPHVVRRADKTVRRLGYAILIIIVLGTVGSILTAGVIPRMFVGAETTVEIDASMSGFSRYTVQVRAGEAVTVRLTSLDHPYHEDGGGQHQWAVDELGLNIIAPPLGSESVTFTPEEPGIYTFYCGICCGGRSSPTMQGTLIVSA